MSLRLFIVDDEAPARARLKTLLSDIAHECPYELVGEADNAQDAHVGILQGDLGERGVPWIADSIEDKEMAVLNHMAGGDDVTVAEVNRAGRRGKMVLEPPDIAPRRAIRWCGEVFGVIAIDDDDGRRRQRESGQGVCDGNEGAGVDTRPNVSGTFSASLPRWPRI